MKYWIGYIDKDNTTVASLYDGDGFDIFEYGDVGLDRVVAINVFVKNDHDTKGRFGWSDIQRTMNMTLDENRRRDIVEEPPMLLFNAITNETYIGFVSDNSLTLIPHNFKDMVEFMDKLVTSNTSGKPRRVVKDIITGNIR